MGQRFRIVITLRKMVASNVLLRGSGRFSHLYLRPTTRLFSSSCSRWSETSTSPVLASLRNDLKTAMRNKDTARLSVLRSILADITNSSKTSNPITTDLQLLTLLRKRTAASQTAVNDFKEAGRGDLVEKEQAQVKILDGYAHTLQSDLVGEEEIRTIVGEVVEVLKQASQKLSMGDVTKKILGPGGKLEGRMVEKKEVVAIIQELVGNKK